MNVQLTLNRGGRKPLWMLGGLQRDSHGRQTPVVHLTLDDPGPVSIDFSNLKTAEMVHVLNAVANRWVISDVPLADLQEAFREKDPRPRKLITRQEYIDRVAVEEEYPTGAAIARSDRHQVMEERFQKRVLAASKGSARAIKTVVSKETDIRFLRTLEGLENTRAKPRKSVLQVIADRVQRIQKEAVKEAHKESSKMSDPRVAARDLRQVRGRRPNEVITYEIEEGEEELVSFDIGAPVD